MTISLHQTDDKLLDYLTAPAYRVWRHLLLQVVVVLITLNIFWDTPDKFIFNSQRIIVWVFYFLVINGVIYLNRYYLAPRLLFQEKRTGYVLAALLLTLLTVLVVGILQSTLDDSGDYAHWQATASGIALNLLSSVISVGFVIAGISALLVFSDWLIAVKRIDDLQSATLQSELKLLRNQINPHFLFNMLNNTNYLIMDNPGEASKVLFKLEDLLRYQVNDMTKERVQLSADIRFLDDYLNLEKMRRDDFEYNMVVEGDVDAIVIPPFLFIPFVENAVKHSQNGHAGSYVYLYFGIKGRKLEFRCENSKADGNNDEKRKEGGIGLANIRRRLDLLYTGDYKLEIVNEKLHYIVKLQLKL